jgi:hypothetical protein
MNNLDHALLELAADSPPHVAGWLRAMAYSEFSEPSPQQLLLLPLFFAAAKSEGLSALWASVA